MIKGINRQVIEIMDTGNLYYERALLVVRPEFASTIENITINHQMVTAIYPFIFIINHFPCFQNSGKQVETPVKVGYGKCFSILGTVFPCRTFKILNLINGYLKKERCV